MLKRGVFFMFVFKFIERIKYKLYIFCIYFVGFLENCNMGWL